MGRLLLWSGLEEWRTEVARVELDGEGMRAIGTQVGIEPLPYRLDYRLDVTGEGFVTRSLHVEAVGEGWERRLRLERDPGGEWAAEVGGDGGVEMPAPGGDEAALEGALDCDLGFSPLTNSMPVLRHGLHREPGRVDFLMAWVSVPDLAVHAAAQRYEHLGRGDEDATVRFASVEDGEETFTAELDLDADGFVRVYPGLARRVTG